jgi:hypothetical protein
MKMVSTPYEEMDTVIGIGRKGQMQEYVYVENVVYSLLLIEKNFNTSATAAGTVRNLSKFPRNQFSFHQSKDSILGSRNFF